ncbi:MAG: glycosyltransferase family 4 protein [Saprospiraceae bacterium]|nr:glycosyltransferase family 4 protein [Saprospiraceae bacterium]
MKKIAFAVTNDISQDRRMIRICNSLQENGYEVTLVGRVLSTSLELPAFKFKTHRIKCIFNKGPKFYAEFNIRLYLYFKKIGADLYGAVDYDTLKGVAKAAKVKGKKIIFDAHEWFEEVPELKGRNKVKNYWIKIAQKGIPQTHLRYTVSQGIAENLERLYSRPFEVIHNYPPLQTAEPGSVREEVLIYVGVLNQGRGLPELVKAMHEINAKLWLVGDGDIREELWTLATQENLLHKIVFKGFVPPADLNSLLLKARVGINLLDGSSLSYRHSLANKFFDYVHAGIPQVFMEFPEYKRQYQQFRVGAPIFDLTKSSIVYAINHLLQDRNYWFNIHIDCLKARKVWCWQNEEKKLLELVNRL